MSSRSKKSTTNTTSQNYDQRVVNDASNGGLVLGAGASKTDIQKETTVGDGAIVTQVDGNGNRVTDGGAFAIVDKLAMSLGAVAKAQTEVARDIALRDSPMGVKYAEAALKAQEAAASEADAPKKTIAALAVAAVLGVLIWKKS